MKRVMLNLFLLAFLSAAMVACSKEEVSPFTPGSGASSTGVEQLREGETNTTTVQGSDNTSSTVTDDSSVGTGGESDDESITDGGNSSDYDTKGSKKKKVN